MQAGVFVYRGVSSRDAAPEPTGMYLRRPQGTNTAGSSAVSGVMKGLSRPESPKCLRQLPNDGILGDFLELRHHRFRQLNRYGCAFGARNALRNRQSTMTGKRRFGAMREKLESRTSDGRISLDLELVYGHCWGGGPRISSGEVHIDAGAIPIRRR